MAQRLSCDERAWIEAMRAAGVGVEETARRLGRHRSTVYSELDRNSRHGRYGAQAAQAAAQARAVRPKTPKLAADPGLAAAVAQRLSMGWSPHAVCADLRVEGRSVCAETRHFTGFNRWSQHWFVGVSVVARRRLRLVSSIRETCVVCCLWSSSLRARRSWWLRRSRPRLARSWCDR